jgi:hypothetical protein
MARIVAIMFFLCKLFFDLPDINTEFPNPPFRHVDDVDSSRSNNVIRQSRMAIEWCCEVPLGHRLDGMRGIRGD